MTQRERLIKLAPKLERRFKVNPDRCIAVAMEFFPDREEKSVEQSLAHYALGVPTRPHSNMLDAIEEIIGRVPIQETPKLVETPGTPIPDVVRGTVLRAACGAACVIKGRPTNDWSKVADEIVPQVFGQRVPLDTYERLDEWMKNCFFPTIAQYWFAATAPEEREEWIG